MLRRVLIGIGVLFALALAGCAVVYSRFRDWRAEQIERLESGSQVAQTAKGPMEYALSGNGARTILLVHGTPGGYDQGARFATAAEQRGFRLLRVSRPGYLRTPLETGSSPAEQADAYAALLDTLGIAKVSIVGVSGGGPSSAQFAARHPDRCEALILLSAVTEKRERRPPPSLVEAFFRGNDFGAWLLWRSAHRNPEGAIARVVSDPATRKRILDSADGRAAYLALADSALVLPSRRVAGIANDARWFVEMPPIPLASIRVPTLAVHGDKDTTVPLQHGQTVAAQVPGAQLVTIPGGDHFISISHGVETFTPVFQLIARAGQPAAPPTAELTAAPTAPE